ncbi:hypothetical protein [Brevibacillus sp. Leaf182]|uniref:hypothetical protein n=1 Tax=Brevibacillus sp. Leaf182 TaxID=1736290 RepID=UPI000AB5F73C|nr:hypothetical protein [Brevibacillus sp. Leaf182]
MRAWYSQRAIDKIRRDHSVDASLLWLALPYGIVEVNDPLMLRTVQVIEEELCAGHGVHRYPADTYYGGGQWLLLSAWLGWYYVKTGRREEAEKIAAWIVSQRQANGLPKQVQEHLLSPTHYEMWVERAGHPAVPLLWSHACFSCWRQALHSVLARKMVFLVFLIADND